MIKKESKQYKIKIGVDPTNAVNNILIFNNIEKQPINKKNIIFNNLFLNSIIKTQKIGNLYIPIHTNNESNIGIYNCSDEIEGHNCWKTSSLNLNESWKTNNTSGFIEYEFKNNKLVNGYILIGSQNVTSSPKSWGLYGYDDILQTWDLLDSKSNQNISNTDKYYYIFNNTKAYRKFKLDITQNSGNLDYLEITYFQLFSGDNNLLPNQIKINASSETPIYFYKYLNTNYLSIDSSYLYKYTEPKILNNDIINGTGIIYAYFNESNNNLEIDLKEFNEFVNEYVIEDDIDNNIIPICTFISNNEGHIIYITETNHIRHPDVRFWGSYSNMPTARGYLGSSTYNNKIYCIGGITLTAKNEEYTPLSDAWSAKTNMPTSRGYLTAGTINSEIYCVSNKNEEYSVPGNSWSVKTNMPTSRTYLASNTAYYTHFCIGGSALTNKNEAYPPATGVWNTKANMLTARMGLSAALHNNIIYCIGGTTLTNKNEAYTPLTDSWVSKINMTVARHGLSAQACNNVICCLGGLTTAVLNSNEEYNPNLESWSTKVNILTSRGYFGSGVVDNIIYFMGGTALTNINEAYSPTFQTTTNFWKQVTNITYASTWASSAVWQHYLFILLGYQSVYNQKYDTIKNIWVQNLTSSFTPNNYSSRIEVPVISDNIIVPEIGQDNILISYNISNDSYITRMSQTSSANTYIPAASKNNFNDIYQFSNNSTYQYKPINDSFTTKSSPSITHDQGLSSVNYNNIIYTFGSTTTTKFNVLNSYDSINDVWSSRSSSIYMTAYPVCFSRKNNTIYYMFNTTNRLYTYNILTNIHFNECLHNQFTTKANFSSSIVNDSLYITSGNSNLTYKYILK